MSGQVLVDYKDKEIIESGRWYINNIGYVVMDKYKDNIRKRELLHRVIMDAKQNEMIDHINGNKLDNRRSNLRFCNKSTNAINSKVHKTNTSGVRGVYWDKQFGKWHGRIGINGKTKHIGLFNNLNDARKKISVAYRQLFGDYVPERRIL